MTRIIPITKARDELTTLVANAQKKLEDYTITVNGTPAAVLMSYEEFEARRETDEILADKKLMKSIRQGEKELAEGKGMPWEEVKKELGLDDI